MWRVLAINALIFAGLLLGVETALTWLVARDAPTGIGLLDRIAAKLYWANVSYVQYHPDCAQYDAELGYTLRPGTCTFTNTAFSTGLSVNSAGLRDDEASLAAPEIVVLGDSQAMGWGVGTGESFADILEAETGRKVLNAGVSSYGTARELGMLSRLDLSRLGTVILQYSDNDSWENRTFLAHGTLETMSEDAYRALVTENGGAGGGFGSYLPALIEEVTARFAPAGDAGGDAMPLPEMDDPDVLIGILSNRDWGRSPPRLVILDINTGGRGGSFATVLSASPKLGDLGSKMRELVVLNTPDILGAGDYLFPDGHLTPDGHRKIAAAIAKVLRPETGG